MYAVNLAALSLDRGKIGRHSGLLHLVHNALSTILVRKRDHLNKVLALGKFGSGSLLSFLFFGLLLSLCLFLGFS